MLDWLGRRDGRSPCRGAFAATIKAILIFICVAAAIAAAFIVAGLRDLKSTGVDVVVILKLDRLTRSVRDLGTLIEDLFGGVALTAVDGSLDSSTAGGRMVVNLLGSVAQWERETTVERIVAALEYKRSRGEWCGRIPFGFKVGEDGKLAEDPEAMKMIAAIKRSQRRSGTTYPKPAKQYGLSVGLVYKLCTTDLPLLRRKVAA